MLCQPRSESSRGTGPKMRFPFGSIALPCFSKSTTAFSSKRIYEPSLRANGLTCRTITARKTSFFFTALRGCALWMETTTTSPIPAYRRLLPPSTLKMRATKPPELSATVTMERSCNIVLWRACDRDGLRGVNREALHLGDRARRDNRHGIPHLHCVAGVVCKEFLRTHEILLVLRVLHIAVYAHGGRILHRRLNDDASECLRTRGVLFHTVYAVFPTASSRARCSVSARAIVARSFLGALLSLAREPAAEKRSVRSATRVSARIFTSSASVFVVIVI